MTLPEPSPGEVRARVEADGVSAYDVMLRRHWFPGVPSVPHTPGEDVVGIVDQLGEGVEGQDVGQRVGGSTFGAAGCYADCLRRPAGDPVPAPDGLDLGSAVALIVNCLAASFALHQTAKVNKGDRLLVQGAGGGSGSALLQLGRDAGLETYGCDATNEQEQIRAKGAQPIDCQQEDVVARSRELTDAGADVEIDHIGGARQLLRSFRALHPNGRLLMLDMADTHRSGSWLALPSLLLLALFAVWPGGRRIAKGQGMETHPRAHPDWYQNTLAGFFDMALKVRIAPRVARRLPLRDAA